MKKLVIIALLLSVQLSRAEQPDIVLTASMCPVKAAVSPPDSFNNPVYTGNLADPYCWYYEGTYYIVCTGRGEGPRDVTRQVPT
jgi:hypothetical protein